MSLPMSDADILKNYRDSKNKPVQIKILAELNDCDPTDIKVALKRAGLLPSEMPSEKVVPSVPIPVSIVKSLKKRALDIQAEQQAFYNSIENMKKKIDELSAEHLEIVNFIGESEE